MNYFFDHHWIIGFIFVLATIDTVGKIVNRIIRHYNIKESGWPPPHLDADGDPIEDEAE